MDLGAKAIRQVKYGFEDFLKSTFKRKMESARNDKNHQKPVVETVAQSIHNAIVAKDDGTTCATSTVSNSDAATPTRLQAASCKTP